MTVYTGRTAWRVITMERESSDEIIQEVRRIKETLAKSMNHDVRRILGDGRRKQKENGRTVVPPPVKRRK
jgi:hypothetical protein